MQIRKADGTTQPFSTNKLRSNLRFLQIPEEVILQTLDELETIIFTEQFQIESTKDLIRLVGNLLGKKNKGVLWKTRYLLKDAIYELGPSGYNFEKYIGRLFEEMGFATQIGVELQGKCVTHEVDVYARKGNEFHFIECKFHNKEGTRSDVTVALYSHARFRDLHNSHLDETDHIDVGWLATNTKLTSQALDYAKCANIQVLSLTLPETTSITKKVIADAGLMPLTVLPELVQWHNELINDGFILLKDVIPTNIPAGIEKDTWLKASHQAEEIMRL